MHNEGVFQFELMRTEASLEMALAIAAIAAAGVISYRSLMPATVMVPSELLKIDLSGQMWVVTGGNTGIGFEVALQLARQGAQVTIACRNDTRAAAAVTTAKNRGVNLVSARLDLADLDSIHTFARSFQRENSRLHGLIANAGILIPELQRTSQGHEMHWGANHLGNVLLVDLLLPLLRAAPAGRIVILSSRAGEYFPNVTDADFRDTPFSTARAYANSKFANALFSRWLAYRLDEQKSPIKVVSVHPGVVMTELFRNLPFAEAAGPWIAALLHVLCIKTAWEGAQTPIFAALSPNCISGSYYANCAHVQHGASVEIEAMGEAVWMQSRQDVGLAPWPSIKQSSLIGRQS